jgi:hypothetical protein
MKKINKKTYLKFLKCLDVKLLEIGAKKNVLEWAKGYDVPEYTLELPSGTYICHPHFPIELGNSIRKNYDVSLYGRMVDAEKAKKFYSHHMMNHYNGKLNFHVGYLTEGDIEEYVDFIIKSLNKPETLP